MNMVELRVLTIGTIFTKMSLLTTSVANFVLDVAISLYTCHWAILISKFFLSLQKSFVELHLWFLSGNRCHRVSLWEPLSGWYKLQSCALSHDNQSIFFEQDFFASLIGLSCLLA
jgi:hypothetical protein